MPIDKIKKSNRLLASRRYTQETLNDNQEAFTSVLDINASEIFIQQKAIPTSSLPYSGSTQNELFVTSGSENILKYYYEFTLTPSSTVNGSNTEVYFFISRSGHNPAVAVDAQLIQDGQQGNFISPKYSLASLANFTTEDATPGYNVVVKNNGAIASPGSYQFDYKNGVLQFSSSAPTTGNTVKISVYQYVGKTLDQFIASGSGGGTGTGFPFVGSASITGSLTVSGSGGITVIGGPITLTSSSITSVSSSISFTTGSITITSGSITISTGSFIGNLTGTASWANNAVNANSATSASYATNAQNILPTLFQIPELGITGSGVVVSSSTALPVNTYNAIKIGNSELIDGLNSNFVLGIGGNGGLILSASLSGNISVLNQNDFDFYETNTNLNFTSNNNNFTVYKSQSANNDATIAFNVNRQTGLLYTSGGASISGSANIQNNLSVGSTLSAGASTLNSLTVTNDATITGNLTVNGTTTYINVDNLLIEDKFILLNSGSTGAVPNEGGIIVQTTSSNGVAAGAALFYEQTTNRWMVARSSSVDFNATSIIIGTTTDYIVTVSASVGLPLTTPLNFGSGDSNNSVGQMHINTQNGDIYIYA